MNKNVLPAVCVYLCVTLSLPTRAHNGDHDLPPQHGALQEAGVVTGWGEYGYKTVPNWCKTKGNTNLGTTNGSVAIDKSGMIYIPLETGPVGILVYNEAGHLQRKFANGFVGIHNLIIHEEDNEEYIYGVHGPGKRAFKLKLDGTVVWTKGCPMESGKYQAASEFFPTAVAVGPDGDIYIADGYGQQWIHQFDKDLTYIRSFGGRGSGPGQFDIAHSIAIDPRDEVPRLIACDRENGRLQYFDLEGTFSHIVPIPFRRPADVSFFGDVVAVAEIAGRVSILGKDNVPLVILGDNPNRNHWANFKLSPKEWIDGAFGAPHGISFDAKGNLFVMDWSHYGRVTRLNKLPRHQSPKTPPIDRFEKDSDAYGAVVSHTAKWSASSTSQWDSPMQYTHLLSIAPLPFLPDFAFHTNREMHPWVRLDLGAPKRIKAVTILNRAKVAQEKARMLTLSVSENGKDWSAVWQADDGLPKWEIDLSKKKVAGRYIRLQVMQAVPTYFHLRNIRIYGTEISE